MDVQQRLDAVERAAAAAGVELRRDRAHRRLYAADASLYQREPLAVAFPRDATGLAALLRAVGAAGLHLTPRGAGTSLAGQTAGGGVVVELGGAWAQIHRLDAAAAEAEVDPGVIQDALNAAAAPHGLEFGPDTSTGDRCTLGGMVGTNACGAYSIVHGTTREHLRQAAVVLADGSHAVWGDESPAELAARCAAPGLDGAIHRCVDALCRQHAAAIRAAFPPPSLVRRNAGYALDRMLDCAPYTPGGAPFNLCRLLCGSEGTLALATRLTLGLVRRRRHRVLVAAHCASVEQACELNLLALGHGPEAVELMDERILRAAAGSPAGRRNAAWVTGQPGAILAIEFRGDDAGVLRERAEACAAAAVAAGWASAAPVLVGAAIDAVWRLRKDGLGLLMGVPGPRQAVTVIEDAAVPVERLGDYVRGVRTLLAAAGTGCCFYGHASAGLLHLRPELDLGEPAQRAIFVRLAADCADLVQRLGGCISGEHGDGRLRGRLLQRVFPAEIFAHFVALKRAADPQGVLNPGCIVDAPPIDADLRRDRPPQEPAGLAFDWSSRGGFAAASAACNGAAVCRRAPGRGVMCPSYQATNAEQHGTRGRANLLRQALADDPATWHADPDLAAALASCLSCKGCAGECPAAVDIGRMKAEFQHARHRATGRPWRARALAAAPRWLRRAALVAPLANPLLALAPRLPAALTGLAPGTHLPRLAPPAARAALRHHRQPDQPAVILVVDAITGACEPGIVVAVLRLAAALGVSVRRERGLDEGRAALSQGLLDEARTALRHCVARLHAHAAAGAWIVGTEPSAILTLADEAPDLLHTDADERARARRVAQRVRTCEQWLAEHLPALSHLAAAATAQRVVLHGHCHQKALTGTAATMALLRAVPTWTVQELATGCCGQAGAFGYASDTAALGRAVAGLALLPALAAEPASTRVCAPGHSCRQQVLHAAGRRAWHPAELLAEACGLSRETR